MEINNKRYTEEEKGAALALLFLSGSLGPQELFKSPRNQENPSPSPSDATDDLIIDESETTAKEDADETLTPETEAEKEAALAKEKAREEQIRKMAESTTDSVIAQLVRLKMSRMERGAVPATTPKTGEEHTLRQKLDRFINEEEVRSTKYHASMKRVYASAVNRPLEKQINRDKNNTASRLSRIRMRNAEQNLRIEAQKLEEANTAKMMKKAILVNYVMVLHEKLKLPPLDFNRPVKELMRFYGLDLERVKKLVESP